MDKEEKRVSSHKEAFVDKPYNQFPQDIEGFYWIPLLGVLLPIIVFLSYAFPAMDQGQPLYMNAAGEQVGKKNFYDLCFSSTLPTVLFILLCVALVALCVPLVLASFKKKFREYKLFNALFTPALAVSAILAFLLPVIVVYQIQTADIAYRAAHEITVSVGAATYLFLGTLYMFIPMLLPFFVLLWWSMANLIAYSRAKKAQEAVEENEKEPQNDIENEGKEEKEDAEEHPLP